MKRDGVSNKYNKYLNDLNSYSTYFNKTYNYNQNLNKYGKFNSYKKNNNYFKKTRTLKDNKYIKNQLIKKNNNVWNQSFDNILSNVNNKIIKNESNNNLTDESTLYQSQKSINENELNSNILSKNLSNSSILHEDSISSKNSKNNNNENNNLNSKGRVFNLKNKFHSRIPNYNNSNEQFNKFNVASSNDSFVNSKVFDNTLILSVKIKVNNDKVLLFKLRRYDDIIKRMNLFCEYNKINENLKKYLVIRILETLNNIYKMNNYRLTQREVEYLINIKKISYNY